MLCEPPERHDSYLILCKLKITGTCPCLHAKGQSTFRLDICARPQNKVTKIHLQIFLRVTNETIFNSYFKMIGDKRTTIWNENLYRFSYSVIVTPRSGMFFDKGKYRLVMDPSHKPSYIAAIACSWTTFAANAFLTFLKLHDELKRGKACLSFSSLFLTSEITNSRLLPPAFEGWGKVIVSVCLFVHTRGGWGTLPLSWDGYPRPGQDGVPPWDGVLPPPPG